MIPASQAMRRMVSTGNGVPRWVSAVRRCPSGAGGVAVEEGVVVDQHHHPTRIGTREALPADQRMQGFGRDLGPLPVGDRLGAGRDPGHDLGVEGPVDGFTAEGVPFTVDALHPGHRVGELPGPGVPALLLQLTDTVITEQPVDPLTTTPLELADPQALGDRIGHQLVGLLLERLLLPTGQAVGLIGQHISVTGPERPVLQRSERFGHLLHRITALGRPGRVPIAQPGLGRGLLRISLLALLLQSAGPSRHLGQHADQPGVHRPDLGTQPVDRVGRHSRDLLLQLADPGRHRDRIGLGDLDHVTVHRERHHTPPCHLVHRAKNPRKG